MSEQLIKMNIIPDTNLWNELGNMKYTIPKALYELIDNSYDARKNDKVNIDIFFSIVEEYIIVKDDAKGMNIEQLNKALTISTKNNNENSIGEHGIGLKSSTSYLCKEFRLITKTENMEEYLVYHHKLNNINEWEIEVQKKTIDDIENELLNSVLPKQTIELLNFKKMNSGTIVIMTELKVKPYPALLKINSKRSLNELISNKYHNKIDKQMNVNIYVRKIKSTKKQIVVSKNIEPSLKIKLKFKVDILGKEISGWVGILNSVYGVNKLYEGINLLKNDHIIESNVTFGYKAHPETRLISGEINMNAFDTTVDKSHIIRDMYYNNAREFVSLLLNSFKFVSLSRNENKIDNDIPKKILKKLNNNKEKSGEEEYSSLYKNSFDYEVKIVKSDNDADLTINENVVYIIESYIQEANTIVESKNKNITADLKEKAIFEEVSYENYDFLLDYNEVLKVKHITKELDLNSIYEYKKVFESNAFDIIEVVSNLNQLKNKNNTECDLFVLMNLNNALIEYFIENNSQFKLDYKFLIQKIRYDLDKSWKTKK